MNDKDDVFSRDAAALRQSINDRSSLVLCSRDFDEEVDDCKVVVSNLAGAAGIVVHDTLVFVSSMLRQSVLVFDMNFDSAGMVTSLTLRQSIPVPASPEGMWVDEQSGDILVTLHQDVNRLIAHRRGEEVALPTSTLVIQRHRTASIGNAKFDVQVVLNHESGQDLRAGSTVSRVDEGIVVGSADNAGLLICPALAA